ncbi:hypothetical protein ACNQR9_26100 [Mycolicibacterium peregrinum]
MATDVFENARKTRCKTDRELVFFDYGHGYIEAALEVPDDIPIVIASAKLMEGRSRGAWIVVVDKDYSDPIDTKTAAIELLDVLAAEARTRAEEAERDFRERWPATHEAFKREMLGRQAS